MNKLPVTMRLLCSEQSRHPEIWGMAYLSPWASFQCLHLASLVWSFCGLSCAPALTLSSAVYTPYHTLCHQFLFETPTDVNLNVWKFFLTLLPFNPLKCVVIRNWLHSLKLWMTYDGALFLWPQLPNRRGAWCPLVVQVWLFVSSQLSEGSLRCT